MKAMALSNPKLLQTVIPLLLFTTLFLNAHSQDITSFTVDNFRTESSELTFQGDAHVPSGATFLRLTGTDASGTPRSWSSGRVLYSHQVHFWDRSAKRQSSFETTIRFTIKPSTTGAADGIAFFIAPVGSTIPSEGAGANLGIFGSSGTTKSLFAVEFDTYVNSGWDPNYRHIGIDIESRQSRNTTRFDSATGQEITARINYQPNTRLISVVATSGSQTSRVSYVYDLKNVLDEWVQVGLSSATGQSGSGLGVHDVHSWYFTSTLVADSANVDSNTENEEAYIRQYVPV